MKRIILSVLLLSFIGSSLQQAAASYHNKCVPCVLNSNNYYYCTQTSECQATAIAYNSCEQGILTCLAYKSTDLGVKEIPPYNKTQRSFNFTIMDGESTRFAISNYDPTKISW